MASIKESFNKSGQRFFLISVSRGRGQSKYTMRWYAPDGWSKAAINRELKKVTADFERKCEAGEVQNRKEKQAALALAEAEAKKIQTLKQYGEAVFMPDLTVTASENTRSSFQCNLDKHIYPALGEFKMPDITSEQIQAMLLNLQSEKHLAHASCIKIYTICNLIFKKAYLSRMIPTNPMDFVSRPKPKKSEMKKEIGAYTEKETSEIISHLNDEPLKWKAFILLALNSGCRRGELCGLKWEDVHADGSITIRNNLCYTPKKGVYNETPKNGKSREVYVEPYVIGVLEELKAEYRADIIRKMEKSTKKHLPINFNQLSISEYVFTDRNGTSPMHPQAPTRYFKKFGDKYGIADFHPHKLRHTFASVSITNGADISSVSEQLGHYDKGITLKMYTHANEESKRRASAIFSAAVNNA